MESVLGRYRNLIILMGVLFLQVLGLAVQVKRGGGDTENTRLIRIWAVGAITPLERGVVWAQNSVGNIWHNYVYLRGVRAENRDLKQQIEQMRIEQVRLSEDAAQARRLQALLAFKEQYIARTVAAQVIGASGSDVSRTVYIDKGEDAGLKRDMAVMTADGIVGKVLLVYPSVSQVLLINDPTSGVGVLLEKSRLQGVLRGTANGEVMLERVMSDEQVPVGERLITSGGDQIFPKGLPVGTVAKVANGKDLFLNIKIKPAADLSKLEEVLVLVEQQNRQATAEDTGRMRAVDILAQRLPSVPDKPADATAGTAATGTGKPSTSPNAANTAPRPANASAGVAPQPAAALKNSATPHPAASAGAAVSAASTTQPSTSPKNSAAANSHAATGTAPAAGMQASSAQTASTVPAKSVAAPPHPITSTTVPTETSPSGVQTKPASAPARQTDAKPPVPSQPRAATPSSSQAPPDPNHPN
jgi:rod shape-determining protein MreC